MLISRQKLPKVRLPSLDTAAAFLSDPSDTENRTTPLTASGNNLPVPICWRGEAQFIVISSPQGKFKRARELQ